MKLNLTPAQLGLIRGLGVAILMVVLKYVGDTANLNGLVSDGTAAIVSMFALSIEHYIESRTGSSLFGAAIEK